MLRARDDGNETPRAGRSITVRAPRFALDGAIPRAWLGGSPVATNVVNALSLIFPEGERFFIRSVKHYERAIADDPELAREVRGFFGQEGRHGHEHDRMNRMLEEHGYDIERFLALYRPVAYEWIERACPPHLRLATTVALEHMTSTLAEVAFTTEVLDDAHPVVRELLLWHATEEIEHKAVAFDVLARVDPRYSTRVAGFAIGALMLGSFWSIALAMLLEQERAMPTAHGPRRSERKFRRGVAQAHAIVRAAVRDYFRRDFHPDDRDNYPLAAAHLARGIPLT